MGDIDIWERHSSNVDSCHGYGHSFVKKSFHKPTYCHHCGEMLWGLIGQGYICEICNFVIHDRCLKQVVIPCLTIANSLIKNPVAHCWSDSSHFKRKFCNVCRKKLDDSSAVRCEVCDNYCHVECLDYIVYDCKDCASYLPNNERSRVQYHHWKEGNLPSNSKCASCKKTCWSSECLTGMRCDWCGVTAHDYCFKKLPPKCDFGIFKPIMLPPQAISVPRIDLPKYVVLGINSIKMPINRQVIEEHSSSSSDYKTSRDEMDSSGAPGIAPSYPSSTSNKKDRGDKDEDSLTIKAYDGNTSFKRHVNFKNLTIKKGDSCEDIIRTVLATFHILDSLDHYFLAIFSCPSQTSLSVPPSAVSSNILSTELEPNHQSTIQRSDHMPNLVNSKSPASDNGINTSQNSTHAKHGGNISIITTTTTTTTVTTEEILRDPNPFFQIKKYHNPSTQHGSTTATSNSSSTPNSSSLLAPTDPPSNNTSSSTTNSNAISATTTSGTTCPTFSYNLTPGRTMTLTPSEVSTPTATLLNSNLIVVPHVGVGVSGALGIGSSSVNNNNSTKIPCLILRSRQLLEHDSGHVPVYPGLLRLKSTDPQNIPLNSQTTVKQLITNSLPVFGLKENVDPANYRLVEMTLEKDINQRFMEEDEKPWVILQNISKESIYKMRMTRFYLQDREDPHGKTVSLFIGNLPPSSSQRQYEAILLGILVDKSLKYKSIGPFYYEYGSLIITYDSTEVAYKAFKTLKSWTGTPNEEKNLIVLLLPNIYPSQIPIGVTPLLIFVNVKSGGCQGLGLISSFRKLLNPHQVFDLENGGPLPGLYVFRNVPKYKILICGGDGTVGWVLSCLDNVGQDSKCENPPCAVIPLGTGNDLARVLNWGPGYTGGEDAYSLLRDVIEAEEVRLDRWTLVFHPDDKYTDDSKYVNCLNNTQNTEDNTQIYIMNNYCGIGLDADISLDFHLARTENPSKFSSRLHNKSVYFKMGLRKMMKRKVGRDLQRDIKLEVDGKEIDLPPVEGLVILNILSWGSGANLWGAEKEDYQFQKPTHYDGMLEIVGVTGVVHMGQIQSGLRSGIRIAQGGHIRITMYTETPVQVDGEPWLQQPGQCVVLKSALKAAMLRKVKHHKSSNTTTPSPLTPSTYLSSISNTDSPHSTTSSHSNLPMPTSSQTKMLLSSNRASYDSQQFRYQDTPNISSLAIDTNRSTKIKKSSPKDLQSFPEDKRPKDFCISSTTRDANNKTQQRPIAQTSSTVVANTTPSANFNKIKRCNTDPPTIIGTTPTLSSTKFATTSNDKII